MAGDDARRLARSRALPRHVLAPFPRRVDARRLGVRRRGRLLVPARAERRHAQHRRQADRPGRARVGRDRVGHRRRGRRGRDPARGQGRDGVAVLRRAARRGARRGARRRRRRGRARQGVQAGAGRVGRARCRRRAVRRSCDAPSARRRSGKIQGTCRRWRIPKRWRRSRPLPELDGQIALVTGGGRGIGANIARELRSAGAASRSRRARATSSSRSRSRSTRSRWSPTSPIAIRRLDASRGGVEPRAGRHPLRERGRRVARRARLGSRPGRMVADVRGERARRLPVLSRGDPGDARRAVAAASSSPAAAPPTFPARRTPPTRRRRPRCGGSAKCSRSSSRDDPGLHLLAGPRAHAR